MASTKSQVSIDDVLQAKGRIKILRLLAKEGELNISEIARRIRLNHNSTRYHLNILTQAKVLQEKQFGRIKIYRFVAEDAKNRAIKNLFDVWDQAEES